MTRPAPPEIFGEDSDGAPVLRATLSAHGMTARVLSWGAVLQDLRLEGIDHPLVLGFEEFADYPRHSPNFGAVVGRVANRIRGGAAVVDGVERRFDLNCLGRHTLHGGSRGTGVSTWRLERATATEAALTLTLPDRHMGFPGALAIRAVYRIEPGPALVFEAVATTDAPTICNLAPHSYFALDGPDHDARDQRLWINADAYLPVDEDLCPTGEVAAVAGGRFDFRTERAIGATGYDHNFALGEARTARRPVARLSGPRSGVVMEIETAEPGLQVYDGATIPAHGPPGLGGARYGPHAGIALEPQAWPDAPNQKWAAQVTLTPGEVMRQTSVFRMSVGAGA